MMGSKAARWQVQGRTLGTGTCTHHLTGVGELHDVAAHAGKGVEHDLAGAPEGLVPAGGHRAASQQIYRHAKATPRLRFAGLAAPLLERFVAEYAEDMQVRHCKPAVRWSGSSRGLAAVNSRGSPFRFRTAVWEPSTG